MGEGLLLIVSGPAGVGKGSVCQALCRQNPNIYYAVSFTTRPPRPGERDGVNYYFVNEEKFKELLQGDSFLEWANVHGNYYGTPAHLVRQKLQEGRDVILEIDTQGARQIRLNYTDGVFVFLLPPTMQDLLKRIMKRGADAPDAVKRRFANAYRELEEIDNYDYLVLNTEIESAVCDIAAIMKAEKCRTGRFRGIVKQLLERGD